MKAELDGKVAVVTGAGSYTGQGAAEARLLAEHGALVIVADLPGGAGEKVAAELAVPGRFVPLDVTDEAAWADLVRTARTDHGRIDILVNNAGIWADEGLYDTTPEAYRRVVEVNQTGVYLGMNAVAPLMRDGGGGSIVNTCSTAGLKGGGMPFAYAASKWAVRGMTRAAAWELAAGGIRVNAICPGVIDTPMIGGGDEARSQLAGLVPSGRLGTPDEVAELVLFLAGDGSKYVSGAEIAIDAAFTA
ncbi:glucose 1-dehydrogenase [Actinomadura barringtoniae]|uniref:Glucose 1-dehydrogenase n=1 Tax=Actinomadura barringtoniae TaxID=1427535 RepID=A0A939TA40_9ACTN|nr:glucose 1-dehydrogenase [Actinomadura barringtoniae]MBO2455738.1 glucose 1-dehydrogenase [Actinomadura barringtoniae]